MADMKNAVTVGQADVKASILAALERIEAMPVGGTLIDQISDDEWLDPSVKEWNIVSGSLMPDNHDELDEVDAPAEIAVA